MFFYKSYNNFLNLKKFNLYNNILNFYKLNTYSSLLYSYQFKYSWIENKTKFDKFYINFGENYFFVEFFQNVNSIQFFEKYNIINNYIKCKNKFGFFKKVNSIKNIYLKNNISLKNNFLENSFTKTYSNESLIFKNFDFVERKLSYFKNNRKMLKNIFKKNKKIEFYVSKFLKKISKIKFLNYLNSFEFSIVSILINSGFFLNKNDIFFFIKNKFIFVNNINLINNNYIVKKNDLIHINVNKYYYLLYRKYLKVT